MSDINLIEQPLRLFQEGFQRIGYSAELVRQNYIFDNSFDASKTIALQANLAAFAQEPVSYRTSCFGVVVSNGNYNQLIDDFKSLGAPYLAIINPDGEGTDFWKLSKNKSELLVKQALSQNIIPIIESNRNEWQPQAVLRAKAINVSVEPQQLDFFDFGLIPELETAIYEKLNKLLNNVSASAKSLYERFNGAKLDNKGYQGLFRLVFRLISAKILGDRGHGAANWLSDDIGYVIRAVTQFYFSDSLSNDILTDRRIQQSIWDTIRNSFNFQNISVEAIAKSFETTWITQQIRKQYSTHATPYKVAEYMVRKLPIQDLELEDRTVFEPFCGHAPFLIASLGRLRELLPGNLNSQEQHVYFKQMLAGIELDPVAKEFAILSLMLADYPNSNGWNIEEADAFASPKFDLFLQKANIVFCNPPYEQFKDKAKYSNPPQSSYQAVEALRRVLLYPPKMLGFVLPRVFLESMMFEQQRKEIAALYQDTEIIALPDNTFLFSEANTILLLAYNSANGNHRRICGEVLDVNNDKDIFLETGIPSWLNEVPLNLVDKNGNPSLWYSPLDPILEPLNSLPRLSNYAELHRGLRQLGYRKNKNIFITNNPINENYKKGMAEIGDYFEPYIIRVFKYIDTRPEIIDKKGWFSKRGYEEPKVIVNAARNSRGAWRITGVIDFEGLYFTQQFFGIWPKVGSILPIEVISAIVNSSVANAFLSSKISSLTNNTKEKIEDIPVPDFSPAQLETIITLTRDYVRFRHEWLYNPDNKALEKMCQDIIYRIDGYILAAYNLKPSLERQLIDYFEDSKRPGPIDHISSRLLPTIKPFKALVRVKNINEADGKQNERTIEAEILSWDPHKVVRFPYSRIPQKLQNSIVRDVMLIANVNVGARTASEIFIDNIDIVVEPHDQPNS